MKIAKKDIVFSIVFLMGALLSFNIYFQQSNFSERIELISENNSTSNCLSSDSEIHDDEQITSKLDTLFNFGVYNQSTSLLFTGQLIRPSFTIWQPPKLS